ERGRAGISHALPVSLTRGDAVPFVLSLGSLTTGPGELGLLDVDLRAEFIDVAIAVAVQGDVGRDVQRRLRRLRREDLRGALEVVVAVNENAGVLVRQGLLQALDVDVGEAEVDGPLDV